jgi:sugar/nucleoside kinase (ribokinase family)
MKQYDIYGIGNALLDMVYEISHETLAELKLDKGTMALINEEQHNHLVEHLQGCKPVYSCGGSAANTIITAQDLGATTFYSCKVANDTTGKLYYHDLITKKADTNLTEDNRPDGLTGKCIVLVTPDFERTMCTFLGVTDQLDKTVINEQAIAHSRMVYLEGYLASSDVAKDAAVITRDIAKQHNIKTSLTLSDPNIVTHFRDNLSAMIGDGVDIIFCNEYEALTFCETDNIDIAQHRLKNHAKQFVITLGNQGAIAFDGKASYSLDAYPTNIIDSVGAGDTFAGAFLYAINDGADFRLAADFANLAAAQVVARLGARLSAPELEEVKKKVLNTEVEIV